MVSLKKLKTAAAIAVLTASQTASAGLIQFDTCIAACETLGAGFNDNPVSLANLSFMDNGEGGVDFTLTNTAFNHDTDHTRGFLTDLFLDFSLTPDGFTNQSDNIDSIFLGTDQFSASGVLYDAQLNFAHRATRIPDRILNDDFATFTLTGITESNVNSNGIVILQRLNLPDNDGFGAARLLGSSETWEQINAQDVPEPGAALLLGLGIAGIALRRRQLKKATTH